MVIKSPAIRKMAQRKPWQFSEDEAEGLREITPPPVGPDPWEFSQDESEDFEEITPLGEPVKMDDFRMPTAPAAIEDEPVPADMKPRTDFTFLPFAPTPDEEQTPVDPQQILGDQVEIPVSPIEKANETLDVREKIFYSLNNAAPLKIVYTTLDGGSTMERRVRPDYVYWAGTNRHILIAWDEMKSDWRAFAVDNIQNADLEEDQTITQGQGLVA